MDFNRVAKLRNSRISSRLSTAIFFMLGVSAMALFAQTSEQQEREDQFIYTTASIYTALRENDPEALGELMENYFRSSFGGAGTISEGIEQFRDPKLQQLLREMIQAGCGPREFQSGTESVTHWYICPPAAADPDIVYLYYRAGFEYSEGRWIFRFFLAGD